MTFLWEWLIVPVGFWVLAGLLFAAIRESVRSEVKAELDRRDK
jgi:hypothetical protein